MMFDLANEEDVKNKIVVPYLQSLGFDTSELSFEMSFQIQVGRSLHTIDGRDQGRTSRPRLDILVQRNGQNLFIVEVKGPDIVIDQHDIDQAVCYARLLHPIAPICLLTNGTDWKLIDSVTKQDVEQTTVNPHMPLHVTLPQETYYQALKYFFGYSRENILTFCHWQIKDAMQELLGSAEDRNKKYIPELYEERKHLTQEAQNFLASGARCFGVVGDSGSGKTCWACSSTLRSLERGIATFFYRGSDVANGILEAISRDLNWVLSHHYHDIQAAKRLLELFEHEQIVIWIDDIDGLSLASVRRMLTEFLRKTGQHPVKLLLTCKSTTWQYLLEEDGSPTALASQVYLVNDAQGYRVGLLNGQEFQAMVMKYRAFYHYDGPFDIEALEVCQRIPFLLRVHFEVAAHRSQPYIGYTVVDFFEDYVQKLCDRFDEQKDMIRRLLIKIAHCFYKLNSDEIELFALLDALNINLLQSLPEQLFSLSILERTYRDQTVYVSFYFKKLRDYLIAFSDLRWHKKSTQDFQHTCSQMQRQGIPLDVLSLYYTLTPVDEHKRVLDSQVYTNATTFLSLYESILDTDFPAFKPSFPPNTSGPIGFVGYLDLSRPFISMHGFRPLKEGETKILLMPVSPMPGAWRNENKGYLVGSLRMHWTDSSHGFQAFDIAQEVFSHHILPRLQESLERGMLDESKNRALLIERVLATCLQEYAEDYQRLHGASQPLFPLQLKELKTLFLYRRAYNLLLIQHIRPQIVKERIEGPSPEELRDIEHLAWIQAQAGKLMSSEDIPFQEDPAPLLLLQDIECLEKLGVREIVQTPLTEWYERGYRDRWTLVHDSNHQEALEALINELLLTFLNEYRILAEHNFPTLYQQFELYQLMPVKMFWAIGKEVERFGVKTRSLLLQQNKRESGTENTVECCSEQEIEQNEQKARVRQAFQESLFTWTNVDTVLLSGKSPLPFQIQSHNNAYLLRKLVYKQIQSDLEDALPVLESRYHA
jgi:hypothetical protein